ncbi:MAG: DUF1178 family protein [Rhodobacteraceae bacterium]|jgi:hypothetical protein|nr:DUF1178 family protein [Paracoccaceae bacterium]
MIRYALSCADGHAFDSWFADAAGFEALAAAGHLACPTCGNTRIGKTLMAPAVRPARKAEARAETPPAPAAPALSEGTGDLERALAELRRQVEANSEYVGMKFATEARRIHDGDAPERAIYGEARPEEAKRLIEDGIPVAPLPFLPTRKAN